MKIKTLLVEIFLDGLIKADLDLRHILVDTIEQRGWGDVVEETSSPRALEVIIEYPANKSIQEDIANLLLSLGFNNYKMEHITIPDDSVTDYLSDFVVNSNVPVSKEVIDEVQKQLGCSLPSDYINLMKEFNGGEGEIGKNSWLCLFPIEEIVTTNRNYNFLLKEIPDYVLIGKDSADTGYAFNKSAGTIHSFGLMSNFKTDQIEFCGNNFTEFIKYLYYQ